MSEFYTVSEIRPSDRRSLAEVDALLAAEGIRRDKNLDYTCGLFDEDYNLVGTGSCFGSTLRCLAVSRAHQGEGLMNRIVTELVNEEFRCGNTHLFVYTKCSSAFFFRDLGFHELVRVEDQVVFLENRRDGFRSALAKWKQETGDFLEAHGPEPHTLEPHTPEKHGAASGPAETGAPAGQTQTCAPEKPVGAIVMNANPFTLGHRHLVEQAAAACSLVHLFLLSEDRSLVPFAVRKKLVLEGTGDLPNVLLHESGPYIISGATFPSYFQRDSAAVIESHARLDLEIFSRIAAELGITRRYVGEEPFSEVTGIYNRIMQEALPQRGVDCVVVPRKAADAGRPISASDVRLTLKAGDFETLKFLVPESTLRFFQSPEAAPVLENIRAAENVIHY